MGAAPTVRWNETAGRWMAWVRFPDGTRRKVERVEKADDLKDFDREGYSFASDLSSKNELVFLRPHP